MKMLGIINFDGSNVNIQGLSQYRPAGAVSFMGRYRLIDIMLSNMTNSGIEEIQVYMQGKLRSLMEHLGSGVHYNINSKRGRLQLLSNDSVSHDLYNHDVGAFLFNLEAIQEARADYVVIAPSYIVYSLDFQKVLETHIETMADITIVYKPIENAKENFLGSTTLSIATDNRIEAMSINQGKYKNRNISLETYVMKKDLFIRLIQQGQAISSMYWFKDVVKEQIAVLNVHGYSFRKDCFNITTLEEYFNANMSLKEVETARRLFSKDWPIYTRTNDSPPTYYGEDAKVVSSIVANGCTIHGRLEDCVIGRGVVVEKGAYLKNCVILPGCRIEKDVHVSYSVIDKKAVVGKIKELHGTPENILYIKRNDRV